MNGSIDSTSLMFFTVVAKHLHFRRAAEELTVPQSTLSRKIAQLEKNLGVKLIERTTRTVSLTRAGMRLYEESLEPLQALNRCAAKLQEEQGSIRGLVRIATTDTLAETNILPVIPWLQQHYPDITLELLLNPAVIDLRFEKIDFAIRARQVLDVSLIARKLTVNEFVRYTSASLPGKKARPYLCYDPFIGTGEPAYLTVTDLNLLRRMVVQGDGEAFLPTVYCREQEERGLLVRVPDSPKQQFDVYLVYPSREYVSRKVRIVMDAVIDYAEKHLNGQAISGKDATTAGCG